MSSLLGGILGPLLGLQPANASTVPVMQVLQSTSINLANQAPQSVYTPVAGNTKAIIVVGIVLRDPNGVTLQDLNQVRILIDNRLVALLPQFLVGPQINGQTYAFASVITANTLPAAPNPSIVATVDNPGSVGNVIIDLLGYAV